MFKKIFLILILIGLITGAVFYWKNNHQPQGAVLGAQTSITDDPANPEILVENYYGQPNFNNLDDMLKFLNVTVYPEDKVAAFPPPELGIGSKIIIQRAIPVTVTDANKPTLYRTFQETIAKLFEEKNIILGDKDKVEPALATKLIRNLEIKITRVQEADITEKVSIPFKNVSQDDPTLDKGKKQVVQKGKTGEKILTYHVVRENGFDKSKTLIKSEITIQPTDEIVKIGTKPIISVACRFNDLVITASGKYGLDPNQLCYRMMKESHGNPTSDGGDYKGLFQYEEGLWETVAAKAGFAGASIWDANAQIYVTAWAWTHGYRGRWPIP